MIDDLIASWQPFMPKTVILILENFIYLLLMKLQQNIFKILLCFFVLFFLSCGKNPKNDLNINLESGVVTDLEGNAHSGIIIDSVDGFSIIAESKDGLLNGTLEKYSNISNSKILYSIENFTMGLKNGPSMRYNSSGDITSIINFKNGKKDGKSIFYNQENAKTSEEIWKNGYKTNEYKFHVDGKKLKQAIQFNKSGDRHGELLNYNGLGNLIEKVPYKNGSIHGDKISYDYYGKRTEVVEYRNGRAIQKYKYVDGKRVSKNILHNTKWRMICRSNSGNVGVIYIVQFLPGGKLEYSIGSEGFSNSEYYARYYGESKNNSWQIDNFDDLSFKVSLYNTNGNGRYITLRFNLKDDLVSGSGTTNYTSYGYLKAEKIGRF